jgi:hypothetical protein
MSKVLGRPRPIPFFCVALARNRVSSLLVKSLTFYLKSLLIRKGGNMVVLQVLTHNVVVAREGKGEWVLVKKKGDTIVATNLEKKYRKIE